MILTTRDESICSQKKKELSHAISSHLRPRSRITKRRFWMKIKNWWSSCEWEWCGVSNGGWVRGWRDEGKNGSEKNCLNAKRRNIGERLSVINRRMALVKSICWKGLLFVGAGGNHEWLAWEICWWRGGGHQGVNTSLKGRSSGTGFHPPYQTAFNRFLRNGILHIGTPRTIIFLFQHSCHRILRFAQLINLSLLFRTLTWFFSIFIHVPLRTYCPTAVDVRNSIFNTVLIFGISQTGWDKSPSGPVLSAIRNFSLPRDAPRPVKQKSKAEDFYL